MKPLPQHADLRVTCADGSTFGLTFLRDGFAPTVPCMHPGCYKAAQLLVYALQGATVPRRWCEDHYPLQWATFVRSLAEFDGWDK